MSGGAVRETLADAQRLVIEKELGKEAEVLTIYALVRRVDLEYRYVPADEESVKKKLARPSGEYPA